MFKKFCMVIFSLIFALVSVPLTKLDTYAYTQADIDEKIEETVYKMYKAIPNPVVASIGGEWTVLCLARSGVKIPQSYYDNYYKNVEDKLKECNGKLHKIKYTEYSRVILALTAINKDVTNVAGYNLLSYLADFNTVKKQGINGPIFALIALDCNNYEIPQRLDVAVQTTRQILIDYILDKEINKGTENAGGWALSGNTADTDITFMAIQALARYKNQPAVKQAIDRALPIISKYQNSDGCFGSWGSINSESTAQVIVGLTALGIDPDKDSRFIKGSKTAVDGLLYFYCEGEGGFAHIKSGYDGGSGSGTGFNLMATDQSLYALISYSRYKKGQNHLYDMTDAKETLAIGNPGEDDNSGVNNGDDKKDDNNNSNDNNDSDNNGGSNAGDDKDDDKNSNNNKDNSSKKSDNSSNKNSSAVKKVKKASNKTKGKKATISLKTVYQGEKNSLIPEDKKCVVVEFNQRKKDSVVTFKLDKDNRQELYYSKELSEKSKCPTYVALFDTSIKNKALLDMDNYEFDKVELAEDGDKSDYEIIFGDANSDGRVNAQDALDIQAVLLGKLDLLNDKQIIAMNVSMDSKIDNGDINQVIQYFVSKADYTIFKIWDKQTSSKN